MSPKAWAGKDRRVIKQKTSALFGVAKGGTGKVKPANCSVSFGGKLTRGQLRMVKQESGWLSTL